MAEGEGASVVETGEADPKAGGADPKAETKESGSIVGAPDDKSKAADLKESVHDFDWRAAAMSTLGEDVADKDKQSFEKWMSRYNNFGEFARGAYRFRQEASQPNRIPGEAATDEERAAFYKTMGVPESVDGYEIEPPEWAKDNEDYKKQSSEILEKFRTEGRFTKDQAKLATDVYNEVRQSEMQAMDARRDQHRMQLEQELEREHGFDLGANAQSVRQFIAKNFSPESQHILNNARLTTGEYVFDSKSLFNDLLNLSKEMGEDTLANGLAGTPVYDDVRTQIENTRAELKAAGVDFLSPEGQRRLRPLYERLSGTKNVAGRAFG